MSRLRILPLAALLATLLVAPFTGTAYAATGYHVPIANYAYDPATLTVTVGDTVTWTNEDTVPHTVTTSSGPVALNSPNLSKGQSWSFTFTVAGTYLYYCAVHPYMRAEVIVRPAATVATTTSRAAITTRAHPTTTAVTPRQNPTTTAPRTGTTSSMAMAPTTSPPTATPTPAVTTQISTQAVGSTQSLQPLLLLAGLAAAIAVFCLLILASRAAR
jgi:amicyanin